MPFVCLVLWFLWFLYEMISQWILECLYSCSHRVSVCVYMCICMRASVGVSVLFWFTINIIWPVCLSVSLCVDIYWQCESCIGALGHLFVCARVICNVCNAFMCVCVCIWFDVFVLFCFRQPIIEVEEKKTYQTKP